MTRTRESLRTDEAASTRREVQFQVNGPCKQYHGERTDWAASLLPFILWVYWPPEKHLQPVSCDSAMLHRATPRGIAEWLAHFGHTRDGCTVCEHMGHVIE